MGAEMDRPVSTAVRVLRDDFGVAQHVLDLAGPCVDLREFVLRLFERATVIDIAVRLRIVDAIDDARTPDGEEFMQFRLERSLAVSSQVDRLATHRFSPNSLPRRAQETLTGNTERAP